MTAPTTPAWFKLATRALHLAQRGELQVAARVITRIGREHGPEVIPNVLLAWIDSCLEATGRPEPGQPVGLMFRNADTGEGASADGVPPHIAWAGRLMAARAAEDRDMFEAVLTSTQTDEEYGLGVVAVLNACALRINAATGGAR